MTLREKAEAYVLKEVAAHDGSYWGWNCDDMALGNAAYSAGYRQALEDVRQRMQEQTIHAQALGILERTIEELTK